MPMKTLSAEFIQERETKGAVRYQEVDSNGAPLDMQTGLIGTLYVRKNGYNRNGVMEYPTSIHIDLLFEE